MTLTQIIQDALYSPVIAGVDYDGVFWLFSVEGYLFSASIVPNMVLNTTLPSPLT